MTAPEVSRYRGYEIVPQRQWSSWCVGIYPTLAKTALFWFLLAIALICTI